jgi:ribose transport system permease protein
MILVVLVVFFSIVAPGYLELQNVRNILLQSSILMILAFGQTLVVLTQGADLSMGAQVSLVTVLVITFLRMGVPLWLAALVALSATTSFGLFSGVLVAKGKMPPFIATFGMQNVIYSLALVITSGRVITHSDYTFQFIYESTFLGVNFPVYIAAFFFVLTWILLYRTRFGMNVFGLGGNKEALELAGVNITLSYLKTYAYAGLLAGFAGLLTTCRVESGQPYAGLGMEFESIAAVLLGGTSMREGKGGIVNTIFGVFLLSVIRNGLNLYGVSAIYQSLIIGTVLLSAIVLDVTVRKLRKD